MADKKALTSFSVRFYRLLLRAYPTEFRQRYGTDMTQTFKDLCLTEGRIGVVLLLLRTILDLSISAPGEHMTILWGDLRYGARMMVKNYTFTAVAIVALALGIGANSAIFSIVNALVLHPFPFRDLDRLVAVYTSRPENGMNKLTVAPADFIDLKRQNAVFDQIGFYAGRDVNITGTGEPERVQGYYVSANFFSILGATPFSGRTLLEEEDQPGHDQVAVLGHGLWIRRFGGDPGVLGKTIKLDGIDHVIVGIMPEDYNYPGGAEILTPLAVSNSWANQRVNGYVVPIARLKPGISRSQAQAEITILTSRLEQQYPLTNQGRKANVVFLREDASGEYTSQFSFALLGASIFVLLIACANIANLQLARATARQKEMAIRAALGASRSRVIRQLLTESVLLSLTGAVMGLPLAIGVLKYIKISMPNNAIKNIVGWKLIGLDTNVLIFTASISVIAGVLFGLAPARQASRPDLTSGLKEGGKSATGFAGHGRLRNILVVSEVALSLILLCGVGLMIKGFDKIIISSRQGIDPDNVLTMRIAPRPSEYKDSRQLAAFYQNTIEQVETLPGVESAGMVGVLPLGGSSTSPFLIEGMAIPPSGREPVSDYLCASGGYFPSVRIPLLKGRLFTIQDDANAPSVALISETMARKFFKDEDPIGRRIKIGLASSNAPWRTIIGVVGDVKSFFFDKEPRSIIYMSHLQTPWSKLYLTVKTRPDPKILIGSVKQRIYSIDRDQPVAEIKTMDDEISAWISGVNVASGLMTFFGVIALILSAAGVYGVMSYTVTQRIHEIGVRMALGAKRIDVLKLIVAQAFGLVGIGLAIGIPVAFALNRFLTGALFNGADFGPATLIAVIAVLIATAALSSYLPARRASSVDPMRVFRSE